MCLLFVYLHNKIKQMGNIVNIGTKFKGIGKVRKNDVYEVVDILNCYSQKDGRFIKSVYFAKGINTLATNEFEVCKTTILRNLIINK